MLITRSQLGYGKGWTMLMSNQGTIRRDVGGKVRLVSPACVEKNELFIICSGGGSLREDRARYKGNDGRCNPSQLRS